MSKENPWRQGQYGNINTAEIKKTEGRSHLGIKVKAQPFCCHTGPSLLCVATQDTAERKVQQVGSSVVCHAGQPLGLKAQTS